MVTGLHLHEVNLELDMASLLCDIYQGLACPVASRFLCQWIFTSLHLSMTLLIPECATTSSGPS